MNEPKVVRFTGAEIVRALMPEIKRKLREQGEEYSERHHDVVMTRWERRPSQHGIDCDVELMLVRLVEPREVEGPKEDVVGKLELERREFMREVCIAAVNSGAYTDAEGSDLARAARRLWQAIEAES